MGKILAYITLYFTSMLPWIEQKAGVVAVTSGMGVIEAFVIEILAIITIVPILIKFSASLVENLKKVKKFEKALTNFENKALESKKKFESYEIAGLFLIVIIPATGTWTAAFIASFLKLDQKKSMVAISLGAICVATLYIFGTEIVINVITKVLEYILQFVR